MLVVKWAFLLLACTALLPAQDQDAYARVLYFADKPGADPAGRDAFLDKVDQGRAAAVAAGESGGYLRLTLVHPSVVETGHVRLAVHFSPAGPTFQSTHTKNFFAATGWNEETYNAQSFTYNLPAVKIEMWRRRVNLGAISKGDYVRLAFVKFKPSAGGDFQKAIPNHRAMMEQVLKSGGPIKGYWLITTMLSGESAYYNAIEVYAYATEAELFKDVRDDASRPNSTLRSQEVFRVSSAYWR